MLTDHKSNKELPELNRKQLKQACRGTFPETKRKLKQGLGLAPLFYYVLTVHQLNDKDQKIVDKALVLCTNPVEAKKYLLKQPGFSYRDISLVKDFECGVLVYKGLAVALFYKRQVTKIEPEPMDPVPTGALESLEDVWARLDLFTKSPKQLVGSLKEELLEKERTILELQQQLRATETLQIAANKQIALLTAKQTMAADATKSGVQSNSKTTSRKDAKRKK
jgi:hypothetical protein